LISGKLAGTMQGSSIRAVARRRAGSRRSGFSLVELVIALVVMVIGVTATFSLTLIAIQADSESAHFTIARATAQREMELIRTKVWSAMPNVAGSTVSVPTTLPNGTVGVTVQPENTSSQSGLDLVTITVSWVEPGHGSDSVAMDTWVTDGGLNTH
jgi:prepilin-type N-terminal cleavage/methylation domain-containing protein